MIPKPPFADDYSPQEELAAFARLKPRLTSLWNALTAREEEPYTSVIVPSLTLDQSELGKLDGAAFYEERLLFLLIRLRNPRAHMVYVTSQPVHPLILEYYFQLLAGIPASHARARLTLLCAHDSSPRSLTEKILERPRLIQRIRYGIADPERAFLTVFNATALERRLAVLLGIPLNGVDPALSALGTKSGSRKVFREAGVALPEGLEDLRSEEDLVEALDELRRRRPGIRRAVVKFEESFSGEGNAIFRYPEVGGRPALKDALDGLTCAVPGGTAETYRRKFAETGGIVEEFLEREESSSPSVQLRIDPQGEVVLISSTTSSSAECPARSTRAAFSRRPIPTAERSRLRATVGRPGPRPQGRREPPRRGFLRRTRGRLGPMGTCALEINLRIGGTTHPFLALQFLTGGKLEETTGHFLSTCDRPKFYRSTDNLRSDAYRGLCPEDLIDIMTHNRLHYSHAPRLERCST